MSGLPARHTLRDGTEVEVRALGPDDQELVSRVFSGLSPESRWHRFLAPVDSLTEEDLAYLTEVDHHRHEALAARHVGTGEGLGVARYVRVPGEPGTADLAVAVADAWQGRGLGTLLLERLTDRAREEGIERYAPVVAPEHDRMVALLESVGARRVPGDPEVVHFVVELPPAGLGMGLRDALRAAAGMTARDPG